MKLSSTVHWRSWSTTTQRWVWTVTPRHATSNAHTVDERYLAALPACDCCFLTRSVCSDVMISCYTIRMDTTISAMLIYLHAPFRKSHIRTRILVRTLLRSVRGCAISLGHILQFHCRSQVPTIPVVDNSQPLFPFSPPPPLQLPLFQAAQAFRQVAEVRMWCFTRGPEAAMAR